MGFLGSGFAACQPPSKDNNEQGANNFSGDFNRSGLNAELTFDNNVGNQHAAGDPAQQGGAKRRRQPGRSGGRRGRSGPRRRWRSRCPGSSRSWR
ncbi:hypothetical protein G6F60_015128 [Rhizopus arrhizus]|nr:hypothetical protein G6F60_015128 [Rhizopus arrhizus]